MRSTQPLASQAAELRYSTVTALLDPAPLRRRLLGGGLAVAGMATTAGWVANRLTPLSGLLADAHTATGEHRQWDLPDGSRLLLGPRTVADLQFGNDRRRVRLSQGTLIAAVAPDALRPFVVATDQGEVRARGARYMVRQTDERTQVGALEHSVVLRTNAGIDRQLAPGRSAWMTTGDITADETPADELAAWQHGMLLVNNRPLGEVVAALRPYRGGLLRVSAAASSIRVLGSFPLQDTDHALQALADTLPIRIHRYTGGWLVTIEHGSA